MNVENAVNPTPEQIEGLLENANDRPIYMVNLLKFREKAEYEDGRETDLTGQEAFSIYAEEVVGHLAKVGAKLVLDGEVTALRLGVVEDLWDWIGIAMYPNRKAMFAMVTDPEYMKSAAHRSAGLEGQLNIEVAVPQNAPLSTGL